MPKLPKDAEAVKHILARNRSHKYSEIARKLMADTPELARMWAALERRKAGDDDLWVWAFLGAATDASTLPTFHYMPARDRRDLSQSISKMAKGLSRALRENGLDGHLIYSEGKLFRGFYLFEDFGESNQAQIDASGSVKVKLSAFLEEIAERSTQKIRQEPRSGKVGKNARAVRFARVMAEWTKFSHGQTLNAVVATATNAVFGTVYAESDIRKLLSR